MRTSQHLIEQIEALLEFSADEVEDIAATAGDDEHALGDAADAPSATSPRRAGRVQMGEQEFQEWLQVSLEDHMGTDIQEISTFADDGIMTNNKGLIVSLTDGSAFQVTIVAARSR